MPTKIVEKIGNIVNVTAGHIVHGCNAQGAMGSGVALALRGKWPEVYTIYRNIYEQEGLSLGSVIPVYIKSDLIVWNAITQENYGSRSRFVDYEAVAKSFERVNSEVAYALSKDTYHPDEIHIPLIGAGRAGGNWNIIKTIIEEIVDFPVTLWLPDSTVTTV